MGARWLPKLGRYETEAEVQARQLFKASSLPRIGFVQCSLCEERYTDMSEHLISRMLGAGWRISTEPPHNLCPEHAAQRRGRDA